MNHLLNKIFRQFMPETQVVEGHGTDRSVIDQMGLRAMAETESDDVFLVGFPKSGNTWLQAMTAALVFGVEPRRCPDSVVQSLIPDVHYLPYYRRYLKTAYFKSHELPSPRQKRVIHIVRDGRDVMVSYWHHLSALGTPCGSLRELVDSANHFFDVRWQDYVQRWQENPYRAEIITIRYEDLRADPRPQLQRLMDFIGLRVTDDIVERVIQQSSFEEMKGREAALGWHNPAWPKDRAFVRRGQVGSHRDEMQTEVRHVFERQARETLQRLGYSLSETKA